MAYAYASSIIHLSTVYRSIYLHELMHYKKTTLAQQLFARRRKVLAQTD